MPVRSEQLGPVRVVTIDDPKVRNALDQESVERMLEEVVSASTDTTVAGIVLTGNGAFCAGANLRGVVERAAGTSSADMRGSIERRAHALIKALVRAPIPTVAAVDGPAVGMGFDIALFCDSILIGPDGWCMQGWGRVGVIPGTGGDLPLRLRNASVLWHLLEHQPRISGSDAQHWGIGEDVAEGTALDASIRRIERLAALPRATLEAYVKLQRADLSARLDEHLAMCAQVQASLLADPEFANRVSALLGRASQG